MENNIPPQYPIQQKNKDNKKLLFLIIPLLLGGIIVFFILRSPSVNSRLPGTTQSSPGQSAVLPLPHIDTVILTDTGFSPAKIVIQKGTAVKWTNNSATDNASVNSDDY